MKIKRIQKIKTSDGNMIPIFRDWDFDINEGHVPKMVYATTLSPNIVKDIILHQRRSSYMTCIQGSVKIEYIIENEIREVFLNSEADDNWIDLILFSPNIPIKIENTSDKTAIIINCPSPSWHPDDQDTIKFKNWSEYRRWSPED